MADQPLRTSLERCERSGRPRFFERMQDMDFAAEGLLDGLDGEERAARTRLLEQLLANGVQLRELKQAVAEDRLALLPVEQVLAGDCSARDVESRTGLEVNRILALRRALGLPEAGAEDHVFSDTDVEAAQSIKTFMEAGFSEQAVTEITRVLGEGMARLSAAIGPTFAQTFLKPGQGEDEVAAQFAAVAENMTPAFEPVLAAAFRAHVLDSVRRAMLSHDELAAGQVADEWHVAVGFADLVGFTRLGAELETHTLGDVVGTFSQLAGQVAGPAVRLVKTIGDAAMLVAREPGPMVEAALTLVEAVEEADLPAVRAGIAWGTAIPRSGDFFGHAVNLASRVTGIARPGSVLCTKEVHDAAPDFDWSFAGRHRLKGIGDSVPLYRARRVAPGRSASEDGAGEELRKRKADRRRR
jgi:adenylate cyclase